MPCERFTSRFESEELLRCFPQQNILAVVLLDDASGNGVSLELVLSVSKPAEVIGVL